MDREQEVIHQQMEETRADLTDKLSALESKVSGTVQTATQVVESAKEVVSDTVEAVTDTVESVKEKVKEVTESVGDAVDGVKESVQGTFNTVAESLNLKLQAERHPWAIFGGAVAVGCLGGYLLSGPRQTSRPAAQASERGSASKPKTNGSHHPKAEASNWFWDQLRAFRGLAVGTMMGVVRDLVTRSLPENLQEQVSGELDHLTKGLGGEPIKGSVLPRQEEEGKPDQSHSETPESHSDEGNQGWSDPAKRGGHSTLAKKRR